MKNVTTNVHVGIPNTLYLIISVLLFSLNCILIDFMLFVKEIAFVFTTIQSLGVLYKYMYLINS